MGNTLITHAARLLRTSLLVAPLVAWGCSDSGVGQNPGNIIDGGGVDNAIPTVDTPGGPDAQDTGAPDTPESEVPDPDTPTGDTGPAPGEFLYPCDQNTDCYSEWCIEAPEGQVCSKQCDADCPDGWSCSQVFTGSGDPSFICVPNDTWLCAPCSSDADCNTPGLPQIGVCIDIYPEPSVCTRKCSATAACPNPFTCENVQPYGDDGPFLDLCIADLTACSCTAKFVEFNRSSVCAVENDYGSCEGAATCTEEGPIPGCSAAEPAPEVCNGVDDDCDGDTDEDTLDCTTYYHDIDGDGFGQGLVGECLCEQPDATWLTQGGDCNELVTAVNPGAVEACNGLDDDCDQTTDEEDSVGCSPQFLDGDDDGYGLDGVTACLCAGAPGYSPDGGECDDLDPNINPGASEACNGVDDDCDGATDEVDADGCSPYFLDQDGDGFGLTDKVKCLCGPTGVYIATKPNDCNDVLPEINPVAPEICNGVDDNCNGETDEGEPSSMCPSVAHGVAGCVAGTCSLLECEDGWDDVDDEPLNGCECAASSLELPGGAGNTCEQPVLLGNLTDAGAEVEITENIVPDTDEDWYQFTAIDGADPSNCDTFNVRAFFVHNPQEQFAFDIFKTSCAASDEICKLSTEFQDTTNFFDGSGLDPKGECPCVAGPTEEVTSPGVQYCTDQTDSYWVRVYRRADATATCAAYTLRVTNGL